MKSPKTISVTLHNLPKAPKEEEIRNNDILVHRIRKSRVLPWDRNSIPTQSKIKIDNSHVMIYNDCIGRQVCHRLQSKHY